jgi:sulfite exporter TauE/SafE/plastocyanin domain-containing protein/copper chaperone CopZ
MGKKKLTLIVEGMTCSSCEGRIERALLAISGVLSAKANQGRGELVLEYEDSQTSPAAAKAAIEKAGYSVRDKKGGSSLVALGLGLLLVAAYMIASATGLFNKLPQIDASIGYGMLFVVGLLTSVHCVAMCGGISLSQSVKAAPPGPEEPLPSKATSRGALDRLIPGLLYNGGRVISYTAIGGIVGALGSAFNFSPTVKGAIAGAAGLFMLYLGLKMLGLVPALPKLSRLVPAGVRAKLARASRSPAGQSRGTARSPFAIGLLNGLMPCGPLQTMQLYALGTGSFFAGALSMLLFSIGTVPLMLSFGLAAAFLPRRILPVMVKASAVLVMFLGLVTFSRAASLAGIALPSFGPRGSLALASAVPASALSASASDGVLGARAAASDAIVVSDKSSGIVAKVENGVQIVTTEFKDGLYVPFTVQAGLPLKWTIRVTSAELNGCNNPVTVPAYGIRKKLAPGDNLVEFTPKKTGAIVYTCWMGMVSSRILVVEDLSGLVSAAGPSDAADGPVAAVAGGEGAVGQGSGSQGIASGASCCSSSSSPAFAGGRVPTDAIGLPVLKDGVQEITITVDARGYTPAAIVLQKGLKAVIKFKASQLTSCNSVVTFPEYNGGLDLSKGQLETPALTIAQDFTFQCLMGMLHGYVKTVDDLSKVDIKKVKAEINAYRASATSGGAGGCCSK